MIETDHELSERMETYWTNFARTGNPTARACLLGNLARSRNGDLYKSNEDYRKFLESKGYPYEYVETDGGHIWHNWRIYLTRFSQKLFK